MITYTIKLNEMVVFPELFLGICLIYLFMYGTFTCYNNSFNFPIIQTSISYLGILTLSMLSFLLINDSLNCFGLNNSISSDYLSIVSKSVIVLSSIIFLLMIQEQLLHQKINYFEYILIFLFSILGIMLLCSSNDLITAYLSIELQSLAFYILAAFKKNSTYSIEAGLKYFVLGAFSSGLFLFGASLIYGVCGSVNIADFKDLTFWAITGTTLNTLPMLDRLEIVSSKTRLVDIENFYLSEYDCDALLSEYDYLKNTILNQQIIKDLNTRIDTYDSLCKYFETGIILQNSNQLNENILNKATENSDIFSYYGCLVPIALKSAIENNIIGNLPVVDFTGTENNTDFDYLRNYQTIATYIPYFMKPDNYQIKTYFYESDLFDLSLLRFALIFILISLFFKLAIAPFHTWSPAVYEESPSTTTFFFAVVPKLAIFILLIKLFYFGFYGFIVNWKYFIILGALLSVMVGAVAGIEQRKLKSLIAYSSISHMGYLLISFSTGSLEGIQMVFKYLIVYMISGLCIWSIFILTRLKNNYINKQNKDLGDLILLRKSNQILALIMATSFFSIAGLPPTIGFLIKMNVFLSAIESSMYFVTLVSILFSVISTFYYIRIVKLLYFEPVLVGKLYYPITTQKAFVLILLFYSFIFFFINPTVLYLLSYKMSVLI